MCSYLSIYDSIYLSIYLSISVFFNSVNVFVYQAELLKWSGEWQKEVDKHIVDF